MAGESRRFVLLHHVGHGPEHWDLCLDVGEVLATWQILENPTVLAEVDPRRPLAARRIPDHRRLYLDYEGPVPRGRGHVTRVERGHWTPLERRPELWTFRLDSRTLSGVFALEREDTQVATPQTWTFRRTAD